MYIEVRKNAFYLKNSQWDKETKKTKSTSTYLGSEFGKAKIELEKLVGVESPIVEELSKAREKYAYDKAISSTKKLWLELGDSKAGLEIFKVLQKLEKAQKKSADKSQKVSDYKSQNNSDDESQKSSDEQSQNNSDYKSQENCDDKSQNKCDEQSQEECDDKSQKDCDSQSQKNSDDNIPVCKKCGTQYQSINRRDGSGSFMGCPNWGNH